MVNYLGSDSHKTRLGGFLSIGTQILVLIYLAQQTTELFMMNDPEILSYARRLYHDEVTDMGIIKVSDDYKFDFGLYFTKGQSNDVLEVPESIGRFATRYTLLTPDDDELNSNYRDAVIESTQCDSLKEGVTEFSTGV